MTPPVKPDDPGAEPEKPRPSAVAASIQTYREKLASGEVKPELKEPAVTGEEPAPEKPGGEGEAPAKPEDEGKPEPAATDATPEGEIEAGKEGEPVVVALPGRNEGEEAYEIAVEDPEAAARLRQAIRGGIRRDQFHRAMQDVEEQREKIQAVHDAIEIDPVGFVFERLPEQHRVDLARQLLAEPGVFEALTEDVGRWQGDERDLKSDRQDFENKRLKQRDTARDELVARTDARTAAREIRHAVDRMIPAEMEDDEAAMFRDDLLRDVRDYAMGHPDELLQTDDVLPIVERRLRQYGVDPAQAAAAAAADEPPPVRTRPARPTAPGARKPDAAAARPTGKDLKARADARRVAAAVPGAGAGSPPLAPSLPKGQGVKQRVQTLRERLGLVKK